MNIFKNKEFLKVTAITLFISITILFIIYKFNFIPDNNLYNTVSLFLGLHSWTISIYSLHEIQSVANAQRQQREKTSLRNKIDTWRNNLNSFQDNLNHDISNNLTANLNNLFYTVCEIENYKNTFSPKDRTEITQRKKEILAIVQDNTRNRFLSNADKAILIDCIVKLVYILDVEE